ncbi:hypothetical protein JTE90_017737 [Oedothorax gibbosus]|uniref:Retrovirus-related Pol polyprotein from type-1 retrotransposable element R1 n=1 Tax=Oedothorax gibbosus TaxID=931172 RepID=A0AAV6UAN3_9ARAC|nr:hypothetical protein JTE90_017737 [Oedothorax gibbosus]
MQVSNDIADNAPTDSKETVPQAAPARRFVDNCVQSGWKVIVSCDANAHHIIWGSKDCNNRGEELLLYILSNGLSILNKGNSPTFITSQRSEVIDVTFCNAKAVTCISNWHVSERDYLSDHRLILFNLSGPLLTPPTGNRNPRKVDWDSYREELGLLLGGNVFNFPSLADIDMTVDNVQSAIVQSFNSNSRVASSGLPRRVPWWSKDLSDLRKECRKLFNKAKKTGDWSVYKMRLTAFNKAVRKAKQDSWKDYCSQMEEAWRQSKAVFIPKPGKADYSVAKAFRPICLSSFLLKTLEKMVDRYIRDEVLPQKPLSKFQYAYQPGKSTETALYDLFTVLDRAVNQKELALATFLDIEGAFDRVPTEAIKLQEGMEKASRSSSRKSHDNGSCRQMEEEDSSSKRFTKVSFKSGASDRIAPQSGSRKSQ